MNRLTLASLLAVITVLAGAIGSPAMAQEDEIRAAMARWSEVYATAVDAAEMQVLYHPDAVFWGTGSREPMVGAAAFGPYFQNQFDNFTNRAHAFVDPVIVFYGDGDVATSTGLYRFTVTPVEGGQPIEVLYRYSFSYVRTDDGWLIIHQHSSQLP